MRVLLFLLLLLVAYPTVYGADLFGNEELAEGELPMADQQEMYQQVFGEKDKAASNSSKKLKHALHLQEAYTDDTYAAIRRYMLRRIEDLTADSKKKEAYALQVFAFKELSKNKEANHDTNSKHVELLGKYIAKADKEQRPEIANEIIQLINENCALSLKEKLYERAAEDYNALVSWLGKAKDKEGANQAKTMVKHIDAHLKEAKKIEGLKEKLENNDSDVKNNTSVGRFYCKHGEWKEAHPYLLKGEEPLLAKICAAAQKKDLPQDQRVQCILDINKALNDKTNKKDLGIRRALLQYGISLQNSLDTDEEEPNKILKSKYTMIGELFKSELDKIGPDPLTGFEIADKSGTLNEDLLIRKGWDLLFDHKTLIMVKKNFQNSDRSSVEIKNGHFIAKAAKGQYNILNPPVKGYKKLMMRFKIYDPESYLIFSSSGEGGWVKDTFSVIFQDGEVSLRGIDKKILGTQTYDHEKWITLSYDWSKEDVVVSINGQAFENNVPYKDNQTTYMLMNLKGDGDDMQVHFSNILGLKR